ncbi:cysteine hydrolase [Helcococcus kunzii]|uniref:cysteine hydrolase family protein n=1 Tax=Helcococcus kunzii TaxID=40091 RepID=UPI001C949066|nr:isochorismatase family cysteine hydrolase [Helcococcus kunzii]QZO76587.1 cysteine hydrolase [Helcococcus kunzii]
MRALINIDYTNDFVASDGKLTAGKVAQDLEEYIVDITKEFYENGDYVVFAIDNHFENDEFHPESKLFPPHNINGTDGQKLYGKLEDLYQKIKNSDNVYYTFKTRYSAFHGTDIETKLRERNITEVHLVGVVTDICVLHTAIDAYNKGFDIVVHEKGVQSFNSDDHKWALQHFKNSLGARVV